MDEQETLAALSALAQPTRLAVFRKLVAALPSEMAAGALALAFDIPHNSLSTHLAVLERAGLIGSRRAGRSVLYSANLDGLHNMTLFLLRDCCGGRAEICAPLIDALRVCAPDPDIGSAADGMTLRTCDSVCVASIPA